MQRSEARNVFTARQTDKGFVVQFLNAKSEEKEATYSVLAASFALVGVSMQPRGTKSCKSAGCSPLC